MSQERRPQKVVKRDPRYGKRVLDDGTVEYTYPRSDGAGVHRRYYKPVALADRKYAKHGPEKTTPLLPDTDRVMPRTRAGKVDYDAH